MARKRTPRSGLRQQALEAVEHGQLSAEEILEGAFAHNTPFKQWLKRRLDAVRETEPRKPHIRRLESLPESVVNHALELARRRFGSRPGVRHVTWGVKRTAGRTTPRDAVILLVDKKRKLKAREPEYLPASLSFSFQRKRYRVATDVRSYSAYGAKQNVYAGNRCRVDVPGNAGTLSAVVAQAQGQFAALFSGHVGKREGSAVTAHTDTGHDVALGTVLKRRDDAEVDAALAGPFDSSLIPYLATRPTQFRDLPLNSPRVKLKLLLRDQPLEAFVDAVGEPANFSSTPGARPMNGLIRLDRMCTKDGDSGAPAVDEEGLIVGFVIGYASVTLNGPNFTYLIPARRAYEAVV